MLGRESWGTFVAVLVPAEAGEARQSVVEASAERDAHATLDALDDDGWRRLLENSTPKSP